MCFRLKKVSLRFPNNVGSGPSMPRFLKNRNLFSNFVTPMIIASRIVQKIRTKVEVMMTTMTQWTDYWLIRNLKWSKKQERIMTMIERRRRDVFSSRVVNIRYQRFMCKHKLSGDIKINCVPELSQFAGSSLYVRWTNDNEKLNWTNGERSTRH